jgi:hypothetical protein
MSKGLIRNKEQVKQAIDFVGTEWKDIHPSDIDAVLEFDNEHLILFEIKRKGHSIPKGQRLLLKRIVDCWQRKGRAIILKGEHQCNDTETIILQDCELTALYYDGFWRKPDYQLSIGKAMNLLGKHWGIKKILK